MGWLWKNFEGFDCTKKVLVLFFRAKFCVATRFYLPDMKFISLAKVSLDVLTLEYMEATKGP